MKRFYTTVLMVAAAVLPLVLIGVFPSLATQLSFAGLLLGAVTAEQLITQKGQGTKGTGGVDASTTIYGGSICFIDASSGYIEDDTNSGANFLAGIAVKTYDNSSGSAGDVQAEFWDTGKFLLTGSGLAVTDVGSKVYASDNYTITTTSTNNTYIGTIVEFVSATQVYVLLDPQAV